MQGPRALFRRKVTFQGRVRRCCPCAFDHWSCTDVPKCGYSVLTDGVTQPRHELLCLGPWVTLKISFVGFTVSGL